MVKKISMTAILICLASTSLAQEVTLGTFGYTRVAIPPAGGVNLVGFNYSSETPLFLVDVFGTDQLTQTPLLPTLADSIYIWNPEKVPTPGYDIYFQKSDGQFYDGANPFGAPKTTEIKAGMAIFLQSPLGSSETNVITFSGNVSMDNSVSINYTDSLITIANPYATDMDLNNTNFNWSSATSGFLPTLADNLYIWNSEKIPAPGYDLYFLKDGVWHEGVSPFAEGQPIIPAGGGAFYLGKNSFTNDVIRPYPAF